MLTVDRHALDKLRVNGTHLVDETFSNPHTTSKACCHRRNLLGLL
jgi:hypothetical protein